MAVSRLLTLWGEDGLDSHLKMVQREYARRAAVMCAAAEEHLKGVATWDPPSAGMFLWLRLGPMVKDAADLQDAMKAAKARFVRAGALGRNAAPCAGRNCAVLCCAD